jgi:hypothetical protein
MNKNSLRKIMIAIICLMALPNYRHVPRKSAIALSLVDNIYRIRP